MLDSVNCEEGDGAREGCTEFAVEGASSKNLKRKRCTAGSLGQTARIRSEMKLRVKSVGCKSYLA